MCKTCTHSASTRALLKFTSKTTEQAGAADTDLVFQSEQRAMQELHRLRKLSLQALEQPDDFFFARVRTPCGHDAQVIIEGREIQSDGGEEDKDNPTKAKKPKPTTAQRPSLHHPVVFPLY